MYTHLWHCVGCIPTSCRSWVLLLQGYFLAHLWKVIAIRDLKWSGGKKNKHQLHLEEGWEGVSGSIGRSAWLWTLGRWWSRSSWNLCSGTGGPRVWSEFIKGKSIVLCDKWSVSVDGERMVDIVYLDFRKAFDVISYKLFVWTGER